MTAWVTRPLTSAPDDEKSSLTISGTYLRVEICTKIRIYKKHSQLHGQCLFFSTLVCQSDSYVAAGMTHQESLGKKELLKWLSLVCKKCEIFASSDVFMAKALCACLHWSKKVEQTFFLFKLIFQHRAMNGYWMVRTWPQKKQVQILVDGLYDLTDGLLNLRIVGFTFAVSLWWSGDPFNLLHVESPGFCHSYFDWAGHELIMRISGDVVIPCLSHSLSTQQQLQSLQLEHAAFPTLRSLREWL